MAAMNISEREIRLATLVAGAVIFYFFLQFFLQPKWTELGRLKEQARAKRLEFRLAEGKLTALQAIEKNRGLIPVKSVMSREEKALEVLNLLSQATAKSGLKLISLKPLMAESGEALKFNLICSGSYKNFYDFLILIYQLRLLVLIDNLTITASDGTKPTINVNIFLTAY